MKIDPLSGFPTTRWKHLPADDKPESSYGSLTDGQMLWKRFYNELVLRAVVKHMQSVDPDVIRHYIHQNTAVAD